MNLDEIDREIVRLLQADASLTARELAEHVGLTATPVWRRVQI
ncbi:MAG: AsnC family protein, partial [Actinomycetota bacterium]|nr:AsnC family protein [Actinomycetota bacterium]